ncbi:MAG: UbiD family decarboxylase [Methanocalculus sp. MSAO_Arc1]|uniref:UbiD family decarboxylase n=1 Tax=Methanocalculus TaxID=71151 RepID=UPI000FF16296|nr:MULTISPECIES: UbiD family decarboxylase [unclassified Methanocalculus]MCP1662888.1 UbiD family decarboxylase [Methanocalculus sp. AMF5]RQD80037.1 MAG: UbiD family decarboxylase [Methanocalculus sp. MSAO_Arc1]
MRDFIEELRERDLLIDVEEETGLVFEAAKMAKSTDKPLFFHKFGGGSRGVMNVTATRETLALALGVDPAAMVPALARCRYDGRVVEEGTLPTHTPDLGQIPVLTHFPLDAGPYITAGIVFSSFGGVENAAIHRMLVTGKDRLTARIVEGRHTYQLQRSACSAGEKLPVGIAIGVHPAVTFASCTRVPEGKELAYAAELMGGELRVQTLQNGVCVPEAEYILEGYLTDKTATEGPFVDITGTYDPVRSQPVIEITGIAKRPDPIYHGIMPAGAEHRLLMGAPYEPRIYQSVAGVTKVRDVLLTPGGAGYLHAVVQIEKQTEGDGKNAIMAAFAAHTSLKHVCVVDCDIAIHDPGDVEFAIATRVRGDRDIMIIPGVRGSSLDPSRIADGLNVKVGVDATIPAGKEEEYVRAGWDA